VQRPRKPRKLAAEELFEYAVKVLGARAYSTADLTAKLKLRAAHLPDVEVNIARLKDIGYLDDNRYADSFAASRVANEGFGKMRILMDLKAHRVPREVAENAVEQALEGRGESELIQAYIERRMPSVAAGGKIDDPRKLAGAFRRLRRAGFSTAPILTALKGLAARPEMAEDFPEDEADDDLPEAER
jgi:regulatory protein